MAQMMTPPTSLSDLLTELYKPPMRNFRDCDRSQSFLLLPDLHDRVRDDDLVHFIAGVAEQVDMSAFHVSRTGFGKAQDHPRMMLGLLVYCYARGLFPRAGPCATCAARSPASLTASWHTGPACSVATVSGTGVQRSPPSDTS